MTVLKHLIQRDFEKWLDNSIKDYAEEKARAGHWSEAEALDRSKADFARLLPQGLETPNTHLFSIEDGDMKVGVLWVSVTQNAGKPFAFIYDFIIFEPYRRKGYGEAAMRALDVEMRALGIEAIGLHVFAHNPAARALYEKVGYEITDLSMVKKLS